MTTKKHEDKQPEKQPEAAGDAAAQETEADEAKPAEKKPKERTFVDAKTGKKIAKPHQGGSGTAATQAVREEMHAERKGNALPFRIGAVVLWVLGIACEVMAILVANGTLFLPAFSQMAWIIVWIVADLVLVVAGSQLWKHANHLFPASKENKLAYWVQTDLGIIIAAIAFAPIVIVLLSNKNLDKQTKQIGSIVAVVALIAALASGVDYHPTTQEDLDQAEAGAAALADDGLAYWTPFGEVYHFNPDCQYIKNSGTIYSGTVQDALDANRDRGCSGCTVDDGTDVLSKADPEAVAEAAANAIAVGAAEAKGNADAEGSNEDEGAEDENLPKAA
ncbi:hypothetical protein [Raoultibacter timonensis]|uniref:Uncharacterized protein n=1 Tax=Raoultibacter timonensis TaxID=1907662 RepID=A0ABN6MDE2_9ACTN|nr:hypothetical protein [Raoultibacter timonensis]BDE95264.1 hypothetical protein CE91St30_05970 [Raoultibacter timonensis]BDF49867.1 hypothetical protein CE91St31_05970 [Raoultibacter timonensis]